MSDVLPASAATPATATARKGTAVLDTEDWYVKMLAAMRQAERYAKALPVDDGWPPFLVVVDVGHCIELHADFSRTGKLYLPFPDSTSCRIYHDDPKATGRLTVADANSRERLRKLWLTPMELDPSRHTAKVTAAIARDLGKLAKSLEESDYFPERVAQFLMRCLFSMFAEDVGLLPARSFRDELEACRGKLQSIPIRIGCMWKDMDKGGYSRTLHGILPEFNGRLFSDADALELTAEQLELLTLAANSDWKDVEPSIFGTLLERALTTTERHKLGAHCGGVAGDMRWGAWYPRYLAA